MVRNGVKGTLTTVNARVKDQKFATATDSIWFLMKQTGKGKASFQTILQNVMHRNVMRPWTFSVQFRIDGKSLRDEQTPSDGGGATGNGDAALLGQILLLSLHDPPRHVQIPEDSIAHSGVMLIQCVLRPEFQRIGVVVLTYNH